MKSPSPNTPPSRSPRRWFSCIAAVAMIAVAAPAVNAQAFSGTYTFGADGNVASFPYNGTPITNLTVSPITKDSITTSSSSGNFRASQWPTGATSGSDVFLGVIDTGKYIQFTITAAEGQVIDSPSITFGVGRSGTGPRQWQWRSSVDDYATALPVTTVAAGLTHAAGVLTCPDTDDGWTGNVIQTSTEEYEGLTSITFRLYGYNSEATTGTGGLQGPLTFGGTLAGLNGVLTVTINPSSFSESATNPAATGTVIRSGDSSSALTVSLTSSDVTEATVPASVVIPANETQATFPVTAVDDNLPDGDIAVIITATGTGYTAGNFQVTVQDDGDLPPVVISQYYEGASTNRFIELHNPSAAPVSLNGLVLTLWSNTAAENWKSTGNTPNSQLALPNVELPAGGTYLIASTTAALPSYAVANADLTNTGVVASFTGNDSVVLYSSNTFSPSSIYDAVSLTAGNEGMDKSFYRLTNGPGYNLTIGSNITNFPAVWGSKTLAEVAAAQLSDPWVLRGSQDPLALALSISPSSFSESAANPAAVGTVTIPAVLLVDLTVSLSSSDSTEATVPASVVIPAGQTAVNFDVSAVDDVIIDGPQAVTITATATGYVNGSFAITVEDDGEVPPPATLAPGAIAFSGFNVDANDDLAFVALAPISGGDVIHFTDNEWNGEPLGSGGAFNTGEGYVTWTAPLGGVSVGTVVTLNNLADSTNGPSSNLGSVTRSAGDFNMGATAESVYAFQGNAVPLGASGFVAAITHHTADSFVGTGLSESQIVYLPTNVDIAIYTGSRSSQTTFSGYLALIANTEDNWISQDGAGDQSNDSIVPDLPFDTTPFTLATPSGNTFANWIAGFPAVGALTGFNDDFDNDGLANALENILGSSPAEFNQGMSAVVSIGGNIVFRHTLNVDPASDLQDSYEWSTNLVNWQASGASAGGTTVTFGPRLQIADGPPPVVEVQITVTGTPVTKIFARLRVDQVVAAPL